MNEFFKNLKNEAQHMRLSQNEKQRMRAALYAAMEEIPAPVREVSGMRAVRSTYVWFSPRFVLPVAVLLVMALGTGTAFAAQGALPGDILYPVKINVNEAVEVALATTPAQKAQTEESIADRRVAEAQTLAVQGRLDATTTQELEDNFNEHASRALAFSGEEAVATSSATSTDTVGIQRRGGKEEPQVPRATAAFRFASTTPEIVSESTSSEAQASDASLQSPEDVMSSSLQSQRNIFNELKQRVGKHGRGPDNTNDNSNQNGNQNGDRGGDQEN